MIINTTSKDTDGTLDEDTYIDKDMDTDIDKNTDIDVSKGTEAGMSLHKNSNNKQHIINFSMFLVATLCVIINFSSSVIILPVYVIELGGNEFLSGLQSTVYFLAAVLFRIYLGPLADRRGRKLPLFIGVFAFATAPLFFLLSFDFYTLTLARVYQAIGLAAFFSAGSSFVADIAPEQKLGMYMGIYRTVHAIALLIGPAKAYYIINHWDYATWFLASFVIGVIGLLFISIIKVKPITAGYSTNPIALMKNVLQNKTVWPIYFGIAIASAAYGSLLTFAVIYITKVADFTNPGIYFTYFAFAGIIANLTVGKLADRFSRPMLAWPCIILFSLGLFALYLLPHHSIFMSISSLLVGFSFSGGLLVLIAWLVDSVAIDLRATALSIQESTIDLSVAFGAFVFGLIGSWASLSASLAVFGTILLFIPIVMIYRLRRVTSFI